MELVGPGPAGGESEPHAPGAVDEDGSDGDEAGASGPVGDWWVPGELAGPATQVVSEDRTGEPRGVCVVVPRGDVFESGAFFEVADGEFDGGVVTMELVGLDDGGVEAGDERVVAPVRPQLRLGAIGEPGAAHDEPDAPLGSFAVVAAGDVGGSATWA